MHFCYCDPALVHTMGFLIGLQCLKWTRCCLDYLAYATFEYK